MFQRLNRWLYYFFRNVLNIARGFNHGRRIDLDQPSRFSIVVDILCVLRLKPQAMFCFCVWYFNIFPWFQQRETYRCRSTFRDDNIVVDIHYALRLKPQTIFCLLRVVFQYRPWLQPRETYQCRSIFYV